MRLGGRYELRQPIAAGGMAQVWSANDILLGREVAVKVLHPHLATNAAFVERFRREAVAAASLSHRSIVAIFDTISENGLEAIVMELIEGLTLRSVLDEVNAMPAVDVVHFGAEIAAALDEAHRAGIVHRDIKPANIMICPDRRVMVTDFGIAKAGTDADLTQTGTLLGTAKYLAPEQVNGSPIDPRSDLYALGVVMFEALTGSVPFKANTDAATALARLHQDAPPVRSLRPNVSTELAAIVARLMDRDPNRRYTRASALEDALRAIRSATGDPNEAIRTSFADESRPVPPLPPGATSGSADGRGAAGAPQRTTWPERERSQPPDPPAANGGPPPTAPTPAVAEARPVPAAPRSPSGSGPADSQAKSRGPARERWPAPTRSAQNGSGAGRPVGAKPPSTLDNSAVDNRAVDNSAVDNSAVGTSGPGTSGPSNSGLGNSGLGNSGLASIGRDGGFELRGVEPSGDGEQALGADRIVRSGRSRILPTALIVALVVGLIGIGALLTDVDERMGIGADSNPLDESGSGLAIAAVNSFDPLTPDEDKAEREDLTAFAFDDDPSTAWETENYGQRRLGGLKEGVGLLIRLEDAVPLNRIELDSNTEGWVAEIYVGGDFTRDSSGWGEPVSTVEAGSNRVVRDLGRVKGDVILLWLRDTGVTAERFRFELTEVVIR